jgi:ATP-dependent Clp protease ATP-binding subunit ClpA
MFERFTAPARDTVQRAVAEATGRGSPAVATEHLLLALTGDGDDLGRRVLRELGVERAAVEQALEASAAAAGLSQADASALATLGIDLDEVRRRVEEAFGPGALEPGYVPKGRRFGGPTFSPGTKQVLEVSLREAIARKDGHIGTEHLLLALVRVRRDLAAGVLEGLGAGPDAVRAKLPKPAKPKRRAS